jgi:hypothetical protein
VSLKPVSLEDGCRIKNIEQGILNFEVNFNIQYSFFF